MHLRTFEPSCLRLSRLDQGIPEQAISTSTDNVCLQIGPCAKFRLIQTILSQSTSYKGNPIDQYALRAHVDAAFGFAQSEGTSLSSDNQQFFSPVGPVVEPPSTIPTNAQALSRTSRPSNAFMIFRSDFVKQHKLAGQRQQELSVMAACAWRALGTEGQSGWYEKAALAKNQYNINPELKAPRQRPKPYRPRVNARDVVQTDNMRPVRETYTTLSPALSARRRMRKSTEQPIISPSTPVQDPLPTARSSDTTSSSALAHALHPLSFFTGHHHYTQDEINTSVSAPAFHVSHIEPVLTSAFDSPHQVINPTEA